MNCRARSCPEPQGVGHFCFRHQHLIPHNIVRSMRSRDPIEAARGLLAAIGCLAMREDRPITAAERTAINRFVV